MKKSKKNNCRKNCNVQNIIIVLLFLFFVALLLYIIFMQVNEYYHANSPILHEIREKLLFLADTPYEKNTILSLKFYEGKKSYTINKRKVFICLYKPGTKEPYPINMLMYVAIHELAHVFCDEIGHTRKFHQIFNNFLYRAEEKGIYDPSIPLITNYCGHT